MKTFVVENIIELRRCDGCGVESDSTEQSTCLTAHVESSDFEFKFVECPSDYFYCKGCMSSEGFCRCCLKEITPKNQNVIITRIKGRKY